MDRRITETVAQRVTNTSLFVALASAFAIQLWPAYLYSFTVVGLLAAVGAAAVFLLCPLSHTSVEKDELSSSETQAFPQSKLNERFADNSFRDIESEFKDATVVTPHDIAIWEQKISGALLKNFQRKSVVGFEYPMLLARRHSLNVPGVYYGEIIKDMDQLLGARSVISTSTSESRNSIISKRLSGQELESIFEVSGQMDNLVIQIGQVRISITEQETRIEAPRSKKIVTDFVSSTGSAHDLGVSRTPRATVLH